MPVVSLALNGPAAFWHAGFGLIFYLVFIKEPFSRWLRKGFLREGRIAFWQCRLFKLLLPLRLVSPMVLPNLRMSKLTENPLPKGLEVRAFAPDDTEACLLIYRMNAPRRFPDEVEREFEKLLENNTHSMLVIRKDGCVIACGGAGGNGTNYSCAMD